MINGHVKEVLAHFTPITLEEMDSVKLMERTDTKFVFESDLVPGILADLAPYYRVLEVVGARLNRYETLYFDTGTFGLYRDHHTGKATRYKVRARRYVESNTCFFEVKHNNNKGRTVKQRVSTDTIEHTLPPAALKILADISATDVDQLRGCIWVDYGRITLVGKQHPERVTLDVDLCYRTDHKRVDLGGLAIAEVKRDRASAPSPAIERLKALRIKQQSFSKYCLGVALTSDSVKANNFKEKLRLVQKLSNAV